MKGKKIDSEFLTEFICKCATEGKNSTEDIFKEASLKLLDIDKKINELEKLKILRSKLFDVIDTFKENSKTKIDNNVKNIILFCKIADYNLAKQIVKLISTNVLNVDELDIKKVSKEDIIVCIKQMNECGIISLINKTILRGKNFDNYNRFLKNYEN
jgi:hypothetical protein